MINKMSNLPKCSLDASSDPNREQLQDELAQLSDICWLSAQIKQAIQAFEANPSLLRQREDRDRSLSVRMYQLATLKKRFVETD
ncbi:hypothetical protein PtB15_15B469 [Puccinia triticina]|nr:hypothetical protein PtB15_15B469 [Puccinia triticina]